MAQGTFPVLGPADLSLNTAPKEAVGLAENLVFSRFLGPRGPLVLPSVGPVRTQEKFGSLIYRHICLVNHLKTHQTNLMAPWDPLDAPLTPLDLLAPPSTPNDP